MAKALTRRPFAVFDIDGTLIRWQLYHAIGDALAKAGLISPTIFDPVRDARMNWKQRASDTSFQAYELEIIKAFDAAITDISLNSFTQAARNAFEEYKDQTYTYTRGLIQELRGKGYLLFAISASQIEIVGMLAKYYGFDGWAASRYEIKQGQFTGRKDVLFGNRKPVELAKLVKKHGANHEGSIGVGDSDSDIPLLGRVERPIAFNPNKLLFQRAQEKGWKIVIERKNMVYELELQYGRYVLA